MNRIVSLVLLACGMVLIVFGISAANSFIADVSRLLKGSPTDRSVWMLIGGIIAAVVGLATLLRTPKNAWRP